jgi:hypothetical protein
MRKERCQKFLNKLKCCETKQGQNFSDEKIVMLLDRPPCSRGGLQHLYHSLFQGSPKQRVVGAVGSDGQKCPIIFTVIYQELMRQHVVLWVQRTYLGSNYIF